MKNQKKSSKMIKKLRTFLGMWVKNLVKVAPLGRIRDLLRDASNQKARLSHSMRSTWVSLQMKSRITLIIWKISPVRLISAVLKITHHVCQLARVQEEQTGITKNLYQLEEDLPLSTILCWEREIKKEQLKLSHRIKLVMMSKTQIIFIKKMKQSYLMKFKRLLKKFRSKRLEAIYRTRKVTVLRSYLAPLASQRQPN